MASFLIIPLLYVNWATNFLRNKDAESKGEVSHFPQPNFLKTSNFLLSQEASIYKNIYLVNVYAKVTISPKNTAPLARKQE